MFNTCNNSVNSRDYFCFTCNELTRQQASFGHQTLRPLTFWKFKTFSKRQKAVIAEQSCNTFVKHLEKAKNPRLS